MADFISVSPYTQKEIYKHNATALDDLDAIIEEVQDDHLEWKDFSFKERAAHVQNLRQMLLNLSYEYGEIAANEMGKPIRQAAAEIHKAADLCNFYAKKSEGFLARQFVHSEFYKSEIHFEPLGIVFGVMPWNFPFWQVLRFAIPAMMAGNGVVIKPAPNVFQSAKALEQLFWECGFPESLFKVLYINEALIPLVVKNPLIKGVAFTGSAEAGAEVAQLAGQNLKKSILELGGSDAFIVLSDADIKKATEALYHARFDNNGQTCIAAKRLIVHRSVANELVNKLVSRLREMKLGDPTNRNTDMGPLARPDLVEKVVEQVEKSVEMGAKVLFGGKRIGETNFYAPTIMIDAPTDSPVCKEEVFGPVLPVFVVDNAEEAIKIANDSDYGLGASIWTSNLRLGEQIGKQLEVGFVAINDRVKSDFRLPFGGTKKSGYGRELSEYGIKEFVNIKSMVVN